MNMKKMAIPGIMLASLIMAGCTASPYSGNVYTGSQAKTAQSVKFGTVVSTRPVEISGGGGAISVGSVGGAVLGGFAGNTVGGGSGRLLATAGGAILGGLAGSAVEKGVSKDHGVEIVVKLDSGETIAVVQSADMYFSPGQKVRLVGSGNNIRVTP